MSCSSALAGEQAKHMLSNKTCMLHTHHFCCCRCSTLTVCLPATSICASTTTAAAADTTAPKITVLLNSMSVNATTAAGQLLVVTTVYVGMPCMPVFSVRHAFHSAQPTHAGIATAHCVSCAHSVHLVSAPV